MWYFYHQFGILVYNLFFMFFVFVRGEGMNHVYPVYPLVPESKEAFKHIVDVILNQD